MKWSSRAVALLAFLMTLLALTVGFPLGEGYQGVDVETCGAKETPCHGVVNDDVTVTIDGPDVVETDTTVTFVITVEGGPAQTYGYFILFTDPDGIGRDLQGNLLFEVEPNSVTRVGDSNTFVVEFSTPRYSVDLTMRVAAVSSDNSGDPHGDGWNFAEKDVEVEYPGSTEYPGMDIPESAYLIGSLVLTIALVLWMTFLVIDRKVKEEVSNAGRREGDEGDH